MTFFLPLPSSLLKPLLASGILPRHRVWKKETGGPLSRAPTRRRTKQHTCVQTSRATLIFPITPTTALTISGLSYTTGIQKAPEISNKNSFFNWVHSLHTEFMNASHSTNLFTNSCDHISTNSKAPLHSHINHNTPQFLYSLWRRANVRNVSFLNLPWW